MFNYHSIAIFLLVGFAALFESTRDSLYSLGQDVGGVGGVGGLTNQYNAIPSCNKTADYTKLYCFNAGAFAGFTPFAIVTTLFWISPLVIVSIGGIVVAHLTTTTSAMQEEDEVVPMPNTITDDQNLVENNTTVLLSKSQQPAQKELLVSPQESERNLATFKFVWNLLSAIWFINPLCAYASSDFYEHTAPRVILAIALAAAFPLSWSAMLVSLPMTSVTGNPAVLGLTKHHVREAHMYMAAWTGFWVFLHAVGEIIYLAATKSLWSSLDLTHNGENLLYVFGLITLVFGILHAVVAILRRRWYALFKALHLPLALFLLVTSTVHWWPFCMFLLPAITAHAFEVAKRVSSKSKDRKTAQRSPLVESTALLLACVGALIALGATWSGRAIYMQRADATRYVPFVFAGLAITLSFVGAFATAAGIFFWDSNRAQF
jgi:hypothetical protein